MREQPLCMPGSLVPPSDPVRGDEHRTGPGSRGHTPKPLEDVVVHGANELLPVRRSLNGRLTRASLRLIPLVATPSDATAYREGDR
jgi:hypothetical protein